jgi:hypothetical protein
MPIQPKQRKFYDIYPTFSLSSNGGKTWNNPSSQKIEIGSQYTETEGHPINPKTGYRNGGGPFYSTRARRSFPTKLVTIGTGSERIRARIGTPIDSATLPTLLQQALLSSTNLRSKDTSDLDQYGTTAIKLVAPTNPNANLGTSLAEIHREGLPSLPGISFWKKRAEIVRAAASEFLNAEFGWLPLKHDVEQTLQSVQKARDILKQYHRDAGRNVRHEFKFPIEQTESSFELSTSASVVPLGPTGYPGFFSAIFGPVKSTLSIKETRRKWFSGCFTYGVPSQTDSWQRLLGNGSDADKLFGTTLTPDVLWELTPWSWAVDYFSNVGDVIANVTNFAEQGLVMRYGYMMEERSTVVTHALREKGPNPALDLRTVPPQTIEFTSKVRRPANPFGFGTSADLSPVQIAILVAAGITLL